MAQTTDAELLALIRDGDRQAEATFAERHWAEARHYARKIGAGNMASDIAQDVMLDMISRPPSALSAVSARPYIRAAIWHAFTRARRGHKPTVPLPPSGESGVLLGSSLRNLAMADNKTSPSAALARQEISRAALRVLGEFPTAEQVVVTLRNREGLSFREISNITGRPEGTERSSHSRAMEKLRHELFSFFCNETARELPTPM